MDRTIAVGLVVVVVAAAVDNAADYVGTVVVVDIVVLVLGTVGK